jgi:hypothetical protein
MDTKNALAILVIATSLAIAIVPMVTQASADKNDADEGLETADEEVHDNTGGLGSGPDLKFHEGTCQGGHTTDALENLGGCDILPEPGESGEHP